MKSMTGYGGAETDHAGTKFNVEPNSVNRKQSDTVINRLCDEDSAKDAPRQIIVANLSGCRDKMSIKRPRLSL